MQRILTSAGVIVIVLGLAALPALAQSSSGGTSKSAQPVQNKLQSTEDFSPEQQAAAKQADCRKQAKAQKLSGAKRRAFLRDCTK